MGLCFLIKGRGTKEGKGVGVEGDMLKKKKIKGEKNITGGGGDKCGQKNDC